MLCFTTLEEFQAWKEREEEASYTTYVKGQQTYHPHDPGDLLNDQQWLKLTFTKIYVQRSDPGIITFAAVMETTGRIHSPEKQERKDHTRRTAGRLTAPVFPGCMQMS